MKRFVHVLVMFMLLYFSWVIRDPAIAEVGSTLTNVFIVDTRLLEPTAVVEVPAVVHPEVLMLTIAPNPFNAETTMRFTLPTTAFVTLSIHNTLGQEVISLVTGERLALGTYAVRWDGRDRTGRDIASGVYLVVLRAGQEQRVQRMVLVR